MEGIILRFGERNRCNLNRGAAAMLAALWHWSREGQVVRLELKVIKDTLLVQIGGELDILAADRIRQEIDRVMQARKIQKLILDLEEISFMDSAGLGVILGRYKKISAVGGKMYIVRAHPGIRKILELAGVHKLVTLCQDEKEIISL